jgi:hypothetical protein
MCSLSRLALVGRATLQQIAHVDLLDDQDFVLQVNLALAL